MAVLPYFPFYPADWLSSPRIMCLTLAQQGAYLRLLAVCWMSGDCSVPDDPQKLAALTGLPLEEVPTLGPFLGPHPQKTGSLTNGRLYKEWKKAHWVSDMRAQAGKKSGKSRRTNVQQMLNISTNKKGTRVHKSEVRIQKSDSDTEVRIRSQKSEEGKDYAGPSVPALETPSQRVWARYREAYLSRYKTEPVRNATVNGQIAQLVKRIRAEVAPDVAAFYVWHNDQYYIKNQHPIGLLLKQCEGLHTQWARGQPVTSSQAMQADKQTAKAQMWREVEEELEQERRTINAKPH